MLEYIGKIFFIFSTYINLYIFIVKMPFWDQVWWHSPVVLALGRSRRLSELHSEADVGDIVSKQQIKSKECFVCVCVRCIWILFLKLYSLSFLLDFIVFSAVRDIDLAMLPILLSSSCPEVYTWAHRILISEPVLKMIYSHLFFCDWDLLYIFGADSDFCV